MRTVTPREGITLGWKVAGIAVLAVLAVLAVAARSVALAGFGLDSLIEIGASIVGGVGDLPRRPVTGTAAGRCGQPGAAACRSGVAAQPACWCPLGWPCSCQAGGTWAATEFVADR